MMGLSTGGLIAALLTIGFAYLLARRTSSTYASLAAVVTICAGSTFLWDLVRDPSTGHALSVPAIAGFTLAWVTLRARGSWLSWVVLPGVFGSLYFFVPGSHVGLLWQAPRVVDVLWSSRGGLFATSLAIYLAVLSLIPLWRVHRALAALGAVMFIVMVWLNGTQGGGFEGLIPFLVPTLAAGITAAGRTVARRPAAAAAAVLSVLVVWNITLVAVARAGRLRIGEIVSFADVGAAQAETIHEWIGHPGSMPANLIFAARNGVSPARFDLMYPNRFLSDDSSSTGQVDVGGLDAVYLADGWHGAERDGEVTFRWADDRARLLVPLDHAAPLLVQVQLRPFDYPAAPPQQLTLEINGHVVAGPMIAAGWQRVDVPTDAALWRSGVNHVALQFSRATRPVDVGAGGDARRLAAAIDYVRFQIPR